jgi:Ca2+-binding RTX toxin-like protein
VNVDLSSGTAGNGYGATDTLTNIHSVIGSAHDDVLMGSAGDDSFDPGAGNNTLNGRGGINTLDYSAHPGAEIVNLVVGSAQNGVGGTDQFSNFQTILLGPSDDTTIGASGNHTINGGGGTNTLDYSALAGPIVITTQTGAAQNGGGTDTLSNIQHFILGSGNDSFTGDGGNYTIDPGGGNNTLNGQSGVDTLNYSTHSGTQTVDVFTGTAQNGLGGTDHFGNIAQYLLGPSDDFVFGGPGNHLFMGGGGNNTINYAHATSPVTVDLALGMVQNGFGGVDHMGAFEFFYGGQGDDTLLGGPGQVFLDGAGGWNIVDYTHAPGSATFDMLHGQFDNGFGGHDHLGNFEVFKGSPNDDLFIAPPGSIFMDGGAGIDTLDYTAQPGAVTVDFSGGLVHNGFGGTDHISNFEVAKTGPQNDTLIGGAGATTLYGGGGNNTFVFKDGFGPTTVADFTNTTGNVLDLSGVSAFHTFADVQAHWTQSGSDVVISDPAGGSVTIQNTTTTYLLAHQNELVA